MTFSSNSRNFDCPAFHHTKSVRKRYRSGNLLDGMCRFRYSELQIAVIPDKGIHSIQCPDDLHRVLPYINQDKSPNLDHIGP